MEPRLNSHLRELSLSTDGKWVPAKGHWRCFSLAVQVILGLICITGCVPVVCSV